MGCSLARTESRGFFFRPDYQNLDQALDRVYSCAWYDGGLDQVKAGLWTWPEIAARDPKGIATRRKDKWNFAPPGGESYARLAERLRPWLDRLSGDAFVVSHGGVARALMALVAGVAPPKAVNAPIAQGRALCFENGSCHWIM